MYTVNKRSGRPLLFGRGFPVTLLYGVIQDSDVTCLRLTDVVCQPILYEDIHNTTKVLTYDRTNDRLRPASAIDSFGSCLAVETVSSYAQNYRWLNS